MLALEQGLVSVVAEVAVLAEVEVAALVEAVAADYSEAVAALAPVLEAVQELA